MDRKDLYQLTDGDRDIFRKARETGDINWFTNFYLRSENSGTWWRPVTKEDLDSIYVPEFNVMAQRWKAGYDQLLSSWTDMGKPDFFIEVGTGQYESMLQEQHDKIFGPRKYAVKWEIAYDTPVFHHNHGILLLPWQKELLASKPDIRVIVGGMGSGKTQIGAIEMLYYAATLRRFRGLALAPFSVQSNEVYQIILSMIEDTLYEERFVIKTPERPMNHIVVGHSGIGSRSTIECYPVLDNPRKVRTISSDMAMIDQTEEMPELDEIITSVGTRFRGQVAGRPRVGKLTFVANSGDNQEMWDLYDEAVTDPDMVVAMSPNSAQNIYLTIKDMQRYQKLIGNTAERRRMFLAGGRPIGSGEIFSKEAIIKCRATWMDDLMEDMLEKQEPDLLAGNVIHERWIHETAPRVGTYRWEMPPDPDGEYIVTADPGWKDPPNRDSAAIGVWKINGFPFVPAHLVAFSWVSGRGSPDPWINQYVDFIVRYRAWGKGAYDSTGSGAGYARMKEIQDLSVEPVSLGGLRKQTYLTLTQKFANAGLFQIPTIEHFFSQMAKYVYPEPQKLRQDIVMMLVVTAVWLERLQYREPEPQGFNDQYDWRDRLYRPLQDDRWGYHEPR